MFNWASLTDDAQPADLGPVAPPRAAGKSGSAVTARYDNATTTPENQRSWWAVDALSAKAANSYQVRKQLRMKSRYEVANNPFLFGVVHSNADDLIDTGPTLQVYSGDAGYDRAVEAAWAEWCAEVDLVEKLRTTKLAKSVDGEGFLCLKTVADLEQPVKLYPCDIEADQVTTPAPATLGDLWVDGLVLHPVTGRPTHFHVLRHHPGDFYFPDFNPMRVDKIAARWVVHWFGVSRPGQVRGVPVFTPSLDLFTELRAFRRAVLGAAEIAADYAAVMEQDKEVGATDTSDDTDTEYQPFARVPLSRKMLTVMPPGAKLNQLDPKQPVTSYEMFQEKCLGEACRPLAYPLNLALGTSQKFNFSSAKLDHINYRKGLTIERDACARTVLERIFRAWFEEAVLCGAVPVGRGLKVPKHEWHWPGYESLDAVVDAQADHERLSNGTDTYQAFWARRGLDWRDVMKQQSDERTEIERLKLEYGDPASKSITESTTTDGDDGSGPPAQARRRTRIRGRIRATKDDNGQEHADDGKFGEGGGGAKKSDDKKADAHPMPAADHKEPSKASDSGSSHDGPKSLAERAKAVANKVKKCGAKAVAVAKTVAEKVKGVGLDALLALHKHNEDVTENVHDWSKVINAKDTGDWLSTHMGVSGGFAASVASHVLSFGLTKIKQRIAARKAKKDAQPAKSGTGRRGWIRAADAADREEIAAAVAEILAAIYGAMGCPEEDLPSAADVLDRMEEHANA